MKIFYPAAFKEQRIKSGYTQKAFGEAVGTIETHVQQWEYGTRSPTATYLLRALMLFRCQPEDLMKDE